MSNLPVGIVPADKASVNLLAGQIATSVWASLRDARSFKKWLDTITTADLEAAPYQFEVNLGDGTHAADLIKSAYADLVQFADIHDGLATLAVAKNFNTFTDRLKRPY